MKRVLLLFSMAFAIGSLTGQEFTVDADFRTRADLGYQGNAFTREIGDKTEQMEGNVEHRARINIGYKSEKFELKFSPQDVRFWGQDPNGSTSRGNTYLSLADAWLKYNFDEKSNIQVGRQALSYDDQRLLGALDWALQGRFFEAVKYTRKIGENGMLDLAVTYNNDNNETDIPDINGSEVYNIADGGERTQSIQMLHYSNKLSDKASFSIIALNNVLRNQVTATSYDMLTLGINPKYSINETISLDGSAYWQTGVNTAGISKDAYQYSVNVNGKPTEKVSFTLGGEVMSGTDVGTAGGGFSFSPLYGTNHLHNGYMDFFFVNQYFNSTGLVDGYLKTKFKLSEKSGLIANAHYFASQAKRIVSSDDKYLGAELDLVFTHKIDKDFNVQVGHSQFFAGDNFKTPTSEDVQSWSWVQLIFKPTLFKTTL